jgi:predicted transcriptional regulator
MSEIFISLKPRFAKLIEARDKDHEFRQYNPKQSVTKFWTYISGGQSELRYIIDVDDPVEYPEQVPRGGIGNEEFNAGDKESTFAFPITHLHRIEDDLTLTTLRDEFDFYPPQRYTYTDQYPTLVEYVRQTCSTKQLF